MITPVRTVLKGRQIQLTPLQIDNIYTHFAWNNDPELNRFDSELPYAEESFGDFKRRFEQMVFSSTADTLDFEIHTNDGVMIGVVFIADISEHNRHATIGITIGDQNYWGKGFGRDAMDLVLQYCFEDLGLHRVQAETFEYNFAWRRLVEGYGFSCEGTERDYLFRDDRYWHKQRYALLDTEYAANNAATKADRAA